MYGQKQIFQCLAIILLMTVLNFYRRVIQQNRDIIKMKSKVNIDIRMRELPSEMITVPIKNTENLVKYPFERNVNDKCAIGFYQKSFNRIQECPIKQQYPDKCYGAPKTAKQIELRADSLAVPQEVKNVKITTKNQHICTDSRNIVYRNTSSLISLTTEYSQNCNKHRVADREIY